MKVLIFGASGATGHELVRQALEQGHRVTAFVRNPEKLKHRHERLTLIEGDVKDYDAVENAIRSQDCVISSLGVSVHLKNDPAVIEGINNIVRAMQNSPSKRFIYLSFVGVSESRNRSGFLIRILVSKIVRKEILDHEVKEDIVRKSSLHWTIVRPPKLTNGNKSGNYRIGEDLRARTIFPTLSRADLSDFMLSQITDKTFINKAVTVM